MAFRVAPSERPPTGPVSLVHGETGEVYGTWTVRVFADEEGSTLLFDDVRRGVSDRLAILLSLEARGLLEQPGSRRLPPEEVTDSRRIRQVLRSVSREGRLVGGRDARGTPFAAHLREVTDETLAWKTETAPLHAPLDMELFGYASAYRLRLEAVEWGVHQFSSPHPDRLSRTRTRRHRRTTADTGMTVRFVHPLTKVMGDAPIVAEVVDFSLSGLALRLDPLDALLFPGLPLGSAEVCWPDGTTDAVPLAVRRVSGETVGVEVVAEGGEYDAAWCERIVVAQNPSCSVGIVPGEALWKVFVDSGYFKIGDGTQPFVEETRRRFEASYELARHAPQVSAQVAWPSERGSEGTASMIKAYSGGWLPTHLAKRPEHPPGCPDGRTILREILLRTYEHAFRDPDCRYLIHWSHVDARFGRYITHELGLRMARTNADVANHSFRAFLGATGDGPRASGDFDIREADPALYPAIEAQARAVSDTFAEAHDLVADRMDLAVASRAWKAAGMERERRILVALRGRRPVAAAVLESGADSLHVMGFLDLVRTFALAPGGETAFADLIAVARQWYADLGRVKFTYFLEREWDPSACGLLDLGPAFLSILPGRLVPEQLQHAWEITSPSRPYGDLGNAA